MSNKPIMKWGKKLKLSAWRARSGGTSFSIEKRYHDKADDTWKTTKSLFKEDLVELRSFIDEAIRFADEDQAQEKAHSTPAAGIDGDDFPF